VGGKLPSVQEEKVFLNYANKQQRIRRRREREGGGSPNFLIVKRVGLQDGEGV